MGDRWESIDEAMRTKERSKRDDGGRNAEDRPDIEANIERVVRPAFEEIKRELESRRINAYLQVDIGLDEMGVRVVGAGQVIARVPSRGRFEMGFQVWPGHVSNEAGMRATTPEEFVEFFVDRLGDFVR